MVSKTIDNYKDSAEISKGNAESKKILVQLLEEISLPKGLFPLENIEEFGYNRDAGFLWFIQKKKIEHNFKKIKQVVSYATEVMAFVEKGKLKKITGVKTKELLLWLSICRGLH
jgi:Protein of unknown function, DUF538